MKPGLLMAENSTKNFSMSISLHIDCAYVIYIQFFTEISKQVEMVIFVKAVIIFIYIKVNTIIYFD
jgi:hypothetical protein